MELVKRVLKTHINFGARYGGDKKGVKELYDFWSKVWR